MKSLATRLALRLLPAVFIALSIGGVGVTSAQAATNQTATSSPCPSTSYQKVIPSQIYSLDGGIVLVQITQWRCTLDDSQHCEGDVAYYNKASSEELNEYVVVTHFVTEPNGTEDTREASELLAKHPPQGNVLNTSAIPGKDIASGHDASFCAPYTVPYTPPPKPVLE